MAVVFAFLLPKIADYADVWDVVTSLSGPAIAALAVATVINVATYGTARMAGSRASTTGSRWPRITRIVDRAVGRRPGRRRGRDRRGA